MEHGSGLGGRQRILVPTLDKNGLESQISEHFGRAPYLALVEVEGDRIVALSFEAGEGPHEEREGSEGEVHARGIHGRIAGLRPDVIIASMIGPRAVSDFSSRGVKLVSAPGRTLGDVLRAYMAGEAVDLVPRRGQAHLDR